MSWESPIEVDDEGNPIKEAVEEQISKAITKTADCLLLSLSAAECIALRFYTYYGERLRDSGRAAQIIEIAKKIGLVLAAEEEAVVDGSTELCEEE